MNLRYFKEMFLYPTDIIRNIYFYRHILVQMVKHEIKGRFAGTIGGFLWNMVHPIIMMIVYLFVFVYVFKLRIGSSAGSGTSVIYIIAGLFPWMIIAEGLSKGTSCLINSANLIQKASFPTEIITAQAVFAPLISHGVVIILLTLYQIVLNGSIGIVLIIPFLVIFQVVFTLGVVFLFATVSVFFRDVMQLVQIVIGLGIFLCPIFYHIKMLPDWAQKAMYLNPFYPIIATYQSLFLNGNIGEWYLLPLSFAWALLFFAVGAFVFSKLKYEFADWL